ncbi:MAG: protein kinase [Acidobacteria bacterium]|nr:protein kinase [Acidobacteriota bacterium]
MEIRPGHDLGPYQVIAAVGEGGMGVVYKARDPVLDRFVAIKLMRAEAMGSEPSRKRFLREVQTAAKVHHQYVAAVYSAVEVQNGIGLVMEFIDGVLLSEALRDPSTTLEDKFRWALQISKAIEAIHEKGIVHRDLKPANIFVTESRRIKVLDFGVARSDLDMTHAGDGETATHLTTPGVLIGTPAYMSPEQARTDPATSRSDLFSLGVIFFEALTGEHPFRRDSRSALIDAICREEPGSDTARQKLEGLGPVVCQIVYHLLEKDPQRRPQSAAAVVEVFDAIVRDSTAGPEMRRAPPRWKTVALGLSALAVIVAVATTAPRLGSGHRSEGESTARAAPVLVLVHPPQFIGDDEAVASMTGDVLASAIGEDGAIRVVHPERLRHSDESAVAAITRGLTDAAAYSGVWSVRTQIVREGAMTTIVARLFAEGAVEPEVLRVQAPRSIAAVLIMAQKLGLRVRAATSDLAATPLRGETSNSDEALLFHLEARQLSKAGDFQKAIPLLQRCLELDPSFVRARLLLALTYDRAGYQRQARDEVTNAIVRLEELRADSASPLMIEAAALSDLIHLRYAEAEEGYRKLATARPGDPSVLRQLAGALSKVNQFEAALQVMSEALATDPLAPDVLLDRADILTRSGRYDEAASSIDEAERVYSLLGVTGGQGEVALRRAYLLFRRNQRDAAEAEYLRAMEIFNQAGVPVFAAKARRSIGDLQLAKWDLEGAERSYKEVLDVAESAGHFIMVIETKRSLGMLYYRDGRYTLAEQYLAEASEEAVKLGNRDFEMTVLINLASLLNAQAVTPKRFSGPNSPLRSHAE